MSEGPSAAVVLAPETERAVGEWRVAHSMDGAAGMPAHVTLLYPLPPVAEVDLAAIGEVASGEQPFSFTVGEVREWPDGVVYLAPEPAEPFIRLTAALVGRFPEHLPYGGIHDEVVPHLTVVHTDDAGARADAAASVAAMLPIRCEVAEIWLMHEVNGRWQRHTAFPLGR